MWIYLSTVQGLAAATGSAGISPAWSGWFTGAITTAAVITTTLSAAVSKGMVRYAVLTADGHHLRVYPYSPWMAVVS